jgi:hypothetical protein
LAGEFYHKRRKAENKMSTFQQECNKIEKSKRSGTGVEDVYKPSIKWFNLMAEVMKSGVLKRETFNNMVNTYEKLY